MARTQDAPKALWCDRCYAKFVLTLAQRRSFVDTGPTVPMPIRWFKYRTDNSYTYGLCPTCVPIAHPDDPVDHHLVRPDDDDRPLLTPKSQTPPVTTAEIVVVTPTAIEVPTLKLALGPTELAYAAKARSENTLRGYRSDWGEWTKWCDDHGVAPMPADPVAVAKYLSGLAGYGAKVGTMSRRLSSIRFAEQSAGVKSQLDDRIVMTVWEGIRRTHGAPPEQSAPIMPPLLWAMLDATPTVSNDGLPLLAGLRDHVLLLVGFVGALRRSELIGIDVDHIEAHKNGATLHIPSSKTNQTGEQTELVILPASTTPGRCPVTAIDAWRNAAGIHEGPLLRGLTKSQKPRSTRMESSSVNFLVKQAVVRAGANPDEYTAHGLRAGFVTYANLMGQSDRSIARQTRHRSMASLGQYVRISDAWTSNAAAVLSN
jgi:integrase